MLAHKIRKYILHTEYGQRSKGIIQVESVQLYFGDILPGSIHAALDSSLEVRGNVLGQTVVVQ